MSPSARATFTLGGRRFTPIEFERRTVLLDHYLQHLFHDAALDAVLPPAACGDYDPGPQREGESPIAYQTRLLNAAALVSRFALELHARLIEWGRVHELLGGFLLPAGLTEQDWTGELAAETARHIAGCSTAEDRALVHRLALHCAHAYLQAGLERLARTPRSAAPFPAALAALAGTGLGERLRTILPR